MNKKQLYESIMRNVSHEVKKALNEISSKTLYNAAEKQRQNLDDDDYLASHDDEYLLKAHGRINKFNQYADEVKKREDIDAKKSELLNRAAQARKEKNLKLKYNIDKINKDIEQIISKANMEDACLDVAYDNDFCDFLYGNSYTVRCGIKKFLKINAYQFCPLNEIMQYIFKDSQTYTYYNDLKVALPKTLKVTNELKNYINDVYYDEQYNYLLSSLPGADKIAQYLYDEFVNRMVLTSDGKIISFDASSDDCSAKDYKYFIDCSYDGAIDDFISRYYNYESDDYLIIKHNYASKYSSYVGVLCKNKKIANEIYKEICEFTERPWEMTEPQLIQKGIIWKYNEYK